MLELRNTELRIDILDPTSDRARLGPRFCWGGFVWQVHDHATGPLLTGPEWPDAAPSAFNGQGLPESFRHRTLEGRPLTWRGPRGVSVGAGEIEQDADGTVRIIEPCRWEIGRPEGSCRVEFFTRQSAAGFHYSLRRAIELIDRELVSTTWLRNESICERLALEWFAHPFFPLVHGKVRAELPQNAILPENAGFDVIQGQLTQKRVFTRMDDGHMDRGLRLPPGARFTATLAHPRLEFLRFATGFAPDSIVIWGNDRTFSFEPYLVVDLAPGESREWSLRYGFGASSGIETPG